MKLAIAAALLSSASAFMAGAPTKAMPKGAVALQAAAAPTVNGWAPDDTKFCYGLPGALDPVGEFDPLGLASELSLEEMKRFREAEVTHGRVAMMASVGYLVGESFHPLFGGEISGPANTHLAQVQEVAPQFFFALSVAIGISETSRALTGWVSPQEAAFQEAQKGGKGKDVGPFGGLLRDDYYPGDIGFDPLGLKPGTAEEFAEMQTKELQHGRLAMLAAAGMCVQEQISHDTIANTFKTLLN